MEKKSKLVSWRFTKKQNLPFGRALFLSGNVDELGAWDPLRALRLQCFESDNWSVEVEIPYDRDIEFKYIEGDYEDIR